MVQLGYTYSGAVGGIHLLCVAVGLHLLCGAVGGILTLVQLGYTYYGLAVFLLWCSWITYYVVDSGLTLGKHLGSRRTSSTCASAPYLLGATVVVGIDREQVAYLSHPCVDCSAWKAVN